MSSLHCLYCKTFYSYLYFFIRKPIAQLLVLNEIVQFIGKLFESFTIDIVYQNLVSRSADMFKTFRRVFLDEMDDLRELLLSDLFESLMESVLFAQGYLLYFEFLFWVLFLWLGLFDRRLNFLLDRFGGRFLLDSVWELLGVFEVGSLRGLLWWNTNDFYLSWKKYWAG